MHDSNSSSRATSHKKSINRKSSSDYENKLYNNEIFKQVFLENLFNMLREKYKKIDVKIIFTAREIQFSIAHVVSKV